MGYFPYTCFVCGGAYQRCGYQHKNCKGGQFCWEEDVVIFVNKKRIEGKYDGYGRVETKEGIYIPSEFNEFIKYWSDKLEYNPETTKIKICCKSCSK